MKQVRQKKQRSPERQKCQDAQEEQDRHKPGRNSWRIFLGMCLIAAGLALLVWNRYEGDQAYAKAERIAAEFRNRIDGGIADDGVLDDHSSDAPSRNGFYGRSGYEGRGYAMRALEINGYPCIGLLTIPRLELVLPVISEYDDEKLDAGLCRYYGDQDSDNLVIAGHNYRRFFKNLEKVQPGDLIIFTDIYGIETRYIAGWLEYIDADRGDEMICGNWDLTLFTCTYGAKARAALRCFRGTGKLPELQEIQVV